MLNRRNVPLSRPRIFRREHLFIALISAALVVGSFGTLLRARDTEASGTFTSYLYLRDYNSNKAYTGVNFEWGNWTAPCCGGSYYTLPIWWVGNYANIMLTSYSFTDWYQRLGP